MTTAPQPESGGDPVPRYFVEFITENARRRAELGAGIGEVKGELWIIKALAFAMTGSALVALSKYVIGW